MRALNDFLRQRPLLALLGLGAVVLGAGLGLRDPWPSDEPRFALVARQMVDHGEYLFPHRGHELYSDKPPLSMWWQAAAFHLTGSWRVAFLLPALLAGLGVLALVHDLARRLYTRRAAALATVGLLFTVHFTFQFKKAQIDPQVVFWITLSCYGLMRHLLLGPSWRWYALAGFAAGIGTITKGVGALALLMLLPYVAARYAGARGLAPIPARDARWLLAPLACVFAIALWLVPMLLAVAARGDPAYAAYADDILLRQTARRYLAADHHLHPPWYYLGVLATMWLPLNLAWPWAFPAWWRRIRRRRDARLILPLGWATLIVLFFSISAGKRDVYVLPALPMVALASAPLLAGLVRRAGPNRIAYGLVIAGALAALGVALAALLGEPGLEQRVEVARGFAADSDAIWWLLLAIGASFAGAAAFVGLRPARRGLQALLAALLVTWLLYSFPGYRILDPSSSAREVMVRARAIAGPGVEIGLLAWKEQNLLHALPPVREFGFLVPIPEQRARAHAWLVERPGRWVFALGTALGPCVDRTRVVEAGRANRRQWLMYRADALRSPCVDDDRNNER